MKKKQKGFNAKILMPLFIVAIMVLSIFGIMSSSSKTKLEYNGFDIYQQDTGGFMLKFGSNRIVFRYFPSELEWVNATEGIQNMFVGPMTYATYNPESEYVESFAQIQYNLGQVLDKSNGVYVQPAFTLETNHNLPVVNCINATPFVPVILFELTNSTEIKIEGSCIKVNAKNREDLLKTYERLLYTILGVME